MKNKLKIMIVALLSMVIVTGCGTKSPTEVVNYYFNAYLSTSSCNVAALAASRA